MAVCPQCGKKFEAKTRTQEFCSHTCRSKYWQTARFRGGLVYGNLMLWRKLAGNPSMANVILQRIAVEVDRWLKEDLLLKVPGRRRAMQAEESNAAGAAGVSTKRRSG